MKDFLLAKKISRKFILKKVNGFTLLELLVVIGIILIVASIAVPSVNGLLRSAQISQAVESTVSLLNHARQIAISKNRSVEVRFYKFKDSLLPGAEEFYQALQSFEMQDNGNYKPLGRYQRFPSTVIMNTGNDLSPFLHEKIQKGVQYPNDAQGMKLPAIDKYEYVAFRFRADGSTDLESSKECYFTLHSPPDKPSEKKPPSDYATIQIEPLNGSIRTYRP